MKGTREGGGRRPEDGTGRGGEMIHRMKAVRKPAPLVTWKFDKGGPCEKGETAAKSGCTPASGEGGKKEGGEKEPEKKPDDKQAFEDAKDKLGKLEKEWSLQKFKTLK